MSAETGELPEPRLPAGALDALRAGVALHGIGTDLLRLARGDALWTRFGERAAAKLLHPLERAGLEAAPDRGRYLARAFAAKEAFVKALGTGFAGVGYNEVGVLREPGCRPRLVFGATLQARLAALGIGVAHLSLSDDGGFVFAFVVLEVGGDGEQH